MARPVSIFGRLEGRVVDFAAWKRRALADNHIDQQEARELLEITQQIVGDSHGVIRTVQFATRTLTGAEGMDSVCVRRQWDARQAELVYLNDYRIDGGPSAA